MMGRQIITERDVREARSKRSGSAPPGALADPQGPGAPPSSFKPDTYLDRIMKYVPIEVITLYVGGMNIISDGIDPATLSAEAATDLAVTSWIWFVFLILLTPLYLYRMQNVKRWSQMAISMACFAIWVIGLPGTTFINLDHGLRSLIVLGWSSVVGLIEPR